MDQIISIIVPVYNSKEYLKKCVSSVLLQSYSHFQLLLVNDGSTDGSNTICEKYAAKDRRIQVIHQKNRGVSAARNTGLMNAVGDWILFIDSDDFVDQDYCGRMLRAAQDNDADVVIARPAVNGQPDVYKYNENEIDKLKRACLAYDETQFSYNIDGPWGKLFRRDIIKINNIRFPEMLSRSEDAWFCATFYEHCTSIACLNWFGYYHIEREGSLCRRFVPDAVEILNSILIENQKWVNQYHPNEETYLAALYHRVLPGIDECEHNYFLHQSNPDSIFRRICQYAAMLNHGNIGAAVRLLHVDDIPKRQYRRRLWLYKLHLGWFFILIKLLKQKV